MNTARAKIISVALAMGLLVAGAFIGAAVDRRWIRGSEVAQPVSRAQSNGRMLRRFTRRLALDEQQVVAVDDILKKSRTDARALRRTRQQEILAVLTPAQQQQFRRMIKRMKARRKARRERRRTNRPHRRRDR